MRIEDIDPPREVRGSASRILSDLKRLGMIPDEQILYQSTRKASYEEAVERLLDQGQAYWCGCSRADLPASGIYPGTCRSGLQPGRKPRSVRLRTDGADVTVADRLQGKIAETLESSTGDFVIRRADDLPAYQLAVVIDDAFQDISDIVRGADLLESTARQVYLQRQLGLPTPRYAHVPVVLGPGDTKLSKRFHSDPISSCAAVAVETALRFLGHEPPSSLSVETLWEWAIENWDLDKVPHAHGRPLQLTAPGPHRRL